MHTYTPRSTRLTAILFVPVIAVLCLPALGANSVPFSDGFDVSDGHTAGNPVTQNAAKGWKATSTAPKVTSAFSYEGGQSAYVPQDEAITNEISTAVQKVWTRFFTRAKLYDGVAANRPTNGLPAATVLFFFSSNGYVVVRSGESWVEKTQDVAGNPMFKVSSNLWTKVDVFSDYSQSKWSLFLTSNITSRLVVDAVPFWRSSSGYTFFAARDDVYVDELSVATTPPADLASLDVDTDGMGDTWELTYFGNISAKNGNADSDGGGAIDRVEFQMGTNPLDANDDPTVMPYFEDFESRTTGWYNVGMRLYLNYLTPSVNNKIRVIDTDHAEEESGFTKCLEILPPAGVSLLMGDAAGSNVVVTMYLKPTLMNDVDPELAATDSVGFLVRQDGTVRVYNGTQWSNTTFKVPTDGRWLGFGAHLDYNSKKWDLYVSTNEVYGEPMVRVASRLAMNTTASGTYLRCLTISNTAETATARLDDLSLNYMGHALVPGGTQDRLAAFEKRTRITEEETRMIMVPYEYSSGKDTLASNLGRDLARDCSDGDTIRVFFANLGGWGKFVRTSPGGVPSWEKVSGYGTVTTPIRRWLPIILTRQPGTTLATPVAWNQASQPLQNMPLYAGGIANGWNMGFWMKSTKNLNATPPAFNSAVQTGDEIRTESYPGVRIYYNNGWREGQALSSKQIRANEWFFFRNRSVNNTLNWSAE